MAYDATSRAGGEDGPALAITSLIEHCLTTAPLRTACEQGDIETVFAALSRRGFSGKVAGSALQISVSHGQGALVRRLLEERVDPAAIASTGSGQEARVEPTPLLIQAALADSPDTIRALVDHGLSVEERGHAATLERGRGSRAVSASLVTTPLGAAAWAQKNEAFAALATLTSPEALNAGAEVRLLNSSDRAQRGAAGRLQEFAWAQGATALMLMLQAAGHSSETCDDATTEVLVTELLSRTADPNLRSGGGDTALHVAAKSGSAGAVMALLQGGADPLLRDAQGDTAESIAVRNRRTPCIKVLSNAVLALNSSAPVVSMVPSSLTALEEEEASERAKLDRNREKLREKKLRQKERERERKRSQHTGVLGDDCTGAGKLGPASDDETGALPTAARSARKADLQLSCEALRARIAQVHRERARTMKQMRQATQLRDEELARAEQCEATLAGLREETAALKPLLESLVLRVRAADEKESHWALEAQQVEADRDTLRSVCASEAEKHGIVMAPLRSEWEALQQDEGLGGEGCPPSTYESEHAKRKAAEDRCNELEEALRRAVNNYNIEPRSVPSLLPPGASLPLASHAELHRLLQQQTGRHVEDMRELVACLSQQIKERDQELEQDVDRLFGSGLAHLLETLRLEGLVTRYAPPAPDPGRARRLQAQLLK